MSERAQQFIAAATNATTVAQFQQVYRDARAADDAEPFSDDDKAALAAAFNATVVRLVAV